MDIVVEKLFGGIDSEDGLERRRMALYLNPKACENNLRRTPVEWAQSISRITEI